MLSIVIPCYNEAMNLPSLIEKCQGMVGDSAEIILVDNISPEILEQWIARARSDDLPLRNDQIEASGGIDETSAAAYAAAGAGRISSGVITHSAPVLDLTMSISGGGIE